MTKTNESLSHLVKQMDEGGLSPTVLARRSLDRARSCSALNAFVSLDDELVMSQAEAASRRWQSGSRLSPIDGIPIAVKDNYLTRDFPTTACSNARPLEPDDIDATIVANLRAAGAVIFGKTNMHEWAYGATNTTSSIGASRNPHNQEHITGGSSGGSAAAVAAGIVPAALGSDTGGSVRIPSSACGIYGFKPSYGRASRYGVLPLSWSLDAPGPMATCLADIAYLLPYFLGPDPKDATTRDAKPYREVRAVVRPRLLNLIGAGLERSVAVNDAIEIALQKVEGAISNVSLKDVTSYFAAWETILHCEASAYHKTLIDTSGALFSPVTRAHLEAGQRLSGVELLQAQKLRANLLGLLLHGLGDWDALVLPTLPVPAPRHGDDWQEFAGRKVTTQDSMTWFCWLGNLAGLPCVTLPVGFTERGLPIGMMLMGRPGRDEHLLSIAEYMDRSINGSST